MYIQKERKKERKREREGEPYTLTTFGKTLAYNLIKKIKEKKYNHITTTTTTISGKIKRKN